MYRACIAIVDASRARLFTFDRRVEPEGVHDELVEQRELLDPARRRRASELFSDSRPGSGRVGDSRYGLDDHRDAAIERMDAEFARTVVSEVAQLLGSSSMHRLIVCASPRMLGQLRDASGDLRRRDLVLDELPRDLVKLTVPQLRDQLASDGLLPPPPLRSGLGPSA